MIVKHFLVPVTLCVAIIDDAVSDDGVGEKIRAELEGVNKRLLCKDFPVQIVNPETADKHYKVGAQGVVNSPKVS